MRLKYYDKHGTEIQAGMLLHHDDGEAAGWGFPGLRLSILSRISS